MTGLGKSFLTMAKIALPFIAGLLLGAVIAKHQTQLQPRQVILVDEVKDYVVTNITENGPFEQVDLKDSGGTIHFKLEFSQVMVESQSHFADTKLEEGDVLSIRGSFLASKQNLPWAAVMLVPHRGMALPNPQNNLLIAQ